jgi:hypothetical protein
MYQNTTYKEEHGMTNKSEPKTVVWMLTEDQVNLLNLLIAYFPCPLDESAKETFERTRYELEQYKLELEEDKKA